MSEELAKQENMDLSIFETQSMTGFENVDNESLCIPFLRIAQSNSPQVMEEESAYIPGCTPGCFYSTVSGKHFGKKLRVVFLSYVRNFVIWGPNLGDFKGNMTPQEFKAVQDEYRQEGGKFIHKETGNRAMDTRNFFVFLPDHPEEGILIFPLPSTGITHAKRILTKAQGITGPNGKQAPLFSSIWEMETTVNKNDQGTWYQIGNKQVTKVNQQQFVDKDLVSVILSSLDMVKFYIDNMSRVSYQEDTGAEEETEF